MLCMMLNLILIIQLYRNILTNDVICRSVLDDIYKSNKQHQPQSQNKTKKFESEK